MNESTPVPDTDTPVECPGLVYAAELEYWIRPRLEPDEQLQPSPAPLRLDGPRIRLSGADLPSIVPDGPLWATLFGREHPAGILDVHQVINSTRFADFWSPQPATRVDVPAPTGVLHMTAALSQAIDALTEQGALVSAKVLRGIGGGEILAVAATDVDGVTVALGDLAGERLHVRESRWSLAEFERCGRELVDSHERFGLIVQGNHVGTHAQNVHVAVPIRMTPGLHLWQPQWPAGLSLLRPWIRPTGNARS